MVFTLGASSRTPTNSFIPEHMSLNLEVSFNYGARIQATVDFLRHDSVSKGVDWESFKRASGKQDSPQADRTFIACRPRYPRV